MAFGNLRRKAGLTEHVEHPVVLGKHVGDKREMPRSRAPRPGAPSGSCQGRGRAAVGHLEGDLGTVGIDRLVDGVRHDVGRIARRGHEAEPIPAPRTAAQRAASERSAPAVKNAAGATPATFPSSNVSSASRSASLTGRMQTVEPSLSTTWAGATSR